MSDADQGVRRQSRHHSYLLQLLRRFGKFVAVQQDGTWSLDEARSGECEKNPKKRVFFFLPKKKKNLLIGHRRGGTPGDPISARGRDNVAKRLGRNELVDGPSVTRKHCEFETARGILEHRPLRLPSEPTNSLTGVFSAGRIEFRSLKTV